MAAKRPAESDSAEFNSKRRRLPSTSDEENEKLTKFLSWCKDNELKLSDKVKVGREGMISSYGVMAVGNIEEGEVIFEVPRKLVLKPETSAISKLLEDECNLIFSESGWVTLLLALLHEYSKPDSMWRAYLDIVPQYKNMDQPMFWPNRDDMKSSLNGTGVPEAVAKDTENIETEFKKIVLKFMQRHPDVFPESCHDLELYKKMVAFVMAYSFTEPSTRQAAEEGEETKEDDSDDDESENARHPFMVPMADMLNHVAKNNAKLEFDDDKLKMVATRDIEQYEEIYNTYGDLPNWQLLQTYGFAERYPDNHHDTVDIPMPILLEVVLEGGVSEEIADAKWEYMKETGIVSADGTFIIGADGIITEEELTSALKVFDMSEEEFNEFKENDGWIEEDDGLHDFSFECIPQLPQSWKDLIKRMVQQKLIHYNNTLKEEEAMFASENFETLTDRSQFSCHVRLGQLKLLDTLLKVCDMEPEDDEEEEGEEGEEGEEEEGEGEEGEEDDEDEEDEDDEDEDDEDEPSSTN